MNLIPVLYFYTPENHSAFMDEVEFLGDSQLYSKLKEITERDGNISLLYRGKEDVDFILKEVMEKTLRRSRMGFLLWPCNYS